MRGVILLGGGAKHPERYLNYGLPVLSTWQAADFVDNTHPNYFGRPGIWGQRCANMILDHSDFVWNIGSRLSVWTVGYNFDRRKVTEDPSLDFDEKWKRQCEGWREQFPWVEKGTHDDPQGGIHPWRFVDAIQKHFRKDEVIVTDMGTALVAAHQVLRLKPPQRLMTSGGLGEMGCALPAAVGASFARDKGEVICLHCDGGMMMNLQELGTIVHHKLPIKIVVFANNGYRMIMQTQETAGYELSGVTPETGVSFPSYRKIAQAWGIMAGEVRTWEDFHKIMPQFFEAKEPALMEYHFPDSVDLLPKILPIVKDGKVESPPFWRMSPDRIY